jgi:hypothetical protein
MKMLRICWTAETSYRNKCFFKTSMMNTVCKQWQNAETWWENDEIWWSLKTMTAWWKMKRHKKSENKHVKTMTQWWTLIRKNMTKRINKCTHMQQQMHKILFCENKILFCVITLNKTLFSHNKTLCVCWCIYLQIYLHLHLHLLRFCFHLFQHLRFVSVHLQTYM